jgi:DNA-binding transcriptional regulator YiaG
MANLNSALNERIARVARKTMRSETGTVRRLVTQHRRDLAALKRTVKELTHRLGFIEQKARETMGIEPPPEPGERVRFSARSVKAQRRRLGLSAEKFGKLVGVTGLTIYSWEAGKFRPRRTQMANLVAARQLGKREALKRLAGLNGNAKKAKGARRRAA